MVLGNSLPFQPPLRSQGPSGMSHIVCSTAVSCQFWKTTKDGMSHAPRDEEYLQIRLLPATNLYSPNISVIAFVSTPPFRISSTAVDPVVMWITSFSICRFTMCVQCGNCHVTLYPHLEDEKEADFSKNMIAIGDTLVANMDALCQPN